VSALEIIVKKNPNAGEAESLFAEATRVDALKDPATAARLFEKVLSAAPRAWPRRAEAIVAYTAALR